MAAIQILFERVYPVQFALYDQVAGDANVNIRGENRTPVATGENGVVRVACFELEAPQSR